MSVLIRYNATGVTHEQYDKINEFFQQAMKDNPDLAGPPQDLQLHVLFGDEGNLQVSEIWASEEAWRSHYDGGILGQALDHGGVQRDPQVLAIHQFWGGEVPSPPMPA